jgi:hypothetical protein
MIRMCADSDVRAGIPEQERAIIVGEFGDRQTRDLIEHAESIIAGEAGDYHLVVQAADGDRAVPFGIVD